MDSLQLAIAWSQVASHASLCVHSDQGETAACQRQRTLGFRRAELGARVHDCIFVRVGRFGRHRFPRAQAPWELGCDRVPSFPFCPKPYLPDAFPARRVPECEHVVIAMQYLEQDRTRTRRFRGLAVMTRRAVQARDGRDLAEPAHHTPMESQMIERHCNSRELCGRLAIRSASAASSH